jgi:hypothetical protein
MAVEPLRLLRPTARPTGLRHLVLRLRTSENFINTFTVLLHNDRAFACSARWFLNIVLTYVVVVVANRRNTFFSRHIFHI